MDLTPPMLRGRHVTLEPLEQRHAADLFAAMRDEEVVRKHMNVRGYQRDTVYFSILDTEWPAVKARLEQRLYSQPTRSRPES